MYILTTEVGAREERREKLLKTYKHENYSAKQTSFGEERGSEHHMYFIFIAHFAFNRAPAVKHPN
jgi:hypothetical protein